MSFQLKCEVKDDKIWELICKQWMNSTNCKKYDDNIVHLKSVVIHDHIYDNGKDCIFFPNIKGNYTNIRKH